MDKLIELFHESQKKEIESNDVNGKEDSSSSSEEIDDIEQESYSYLQSLISVPTTSYSSIQKNWKLDYWSLNVKNDLITSIAVSNDGNWLSIGYDKVYFYIILYFFLFRELIFTLFIVILEIPIELKNYKKLMMVVFVVCNFTFF
jgi:hypothetical protein